MNTDKSYTTTAINECVGKATTQLHEALQVNATGFTIAEAYRIGHELNSAVNKLYRVQEFTRKMSEPVSDTHYLDR